MRNHGNSGIRFVFVLVKYQYPLRSNITSELIGVPQDGAPEMPHLMVGVSEARGVSLLCLFQISYSFHIDFIYSDAFQL